MILKNKNSHAEFGSFGNGAAKFVSKNADAPF